MKRKKIISLILFFTVIIVVIGYAVYTSYLQMVSDPFYNVDSRSLFKGLYTVDGEPLLVGRAGEKIVMVIDVPKGWRSSKGYVSVSLFKDIAWADDGLVTSSILGDGEHKITVVFAEPTMYPIRSYYVKVDGFRVVDFQVMRQNPDE